jgi:hypothetical protein
MLEKFARDKHSSLLQKFINYGQKGFRTLAPAAGTFLALRSLEEVGTVFIYLSKKSYGKGRLRTVDLLVLTTLDHHLKVIETFLQNKLA